MNIIVSDKHKRKLARLSIGEGRVDIDGECDLAFKNFLEESLNDGVEVFRDDVTKSGNRSLITLSLVKVGLLDPNFYRHFYNFLYRKGYIVYELDTPVDEEIHKILADFPDDAEKREVLNSLNRLERLEKTTILTILKGSSSAESSQSK